MSHKMSRKCIVKVSVLGYFPHRIIIHLYTYLVGHEEDIIVPIWTPQQTVRAA